MRGKLYFDGGAEPNPGAMGAGVVLELGRGRTEEHALDFDRDGTNNVAEYEGLIFGLERALANGVRQLHVYGDSQLVVRQMNGRYQVRKAHLRVLHQKAQALADRFDECRITWLGRDENERADALAREGRAVSRKRARRQGYRAWKRSLTGKG